MSEHFDAVIIGSGIGGLTAARVLSVFGRKRVLVLEQHSTLGGLTHVFARRKGTGAPDYEFATGVHYFGRNAELASLPALLAQLTEGHIQWCAMPDPYDIVTFPGWRFAIPNDESTYKARLIERFPDERAAIERFFRDIRGMAKGIVGAGLIGQLPRFVRPIARWLLPRILPLAFMRTKAYLDRRIADPALRALLAAQWGDYGSPPSIAAFAMHALIVQHYIGGAVYPLGGPAQISAAMIDILRRDGCELRSGQLVREILVEEGRAVGVRVERSRGGESHEIRASLVVSTAGLRNTYGSLLPPAQRARFAPALAKLADSSSAIVLFLGLKDSPAKLGFDGANHWIYPTEDHEALVEARPGEGVIFMSFPSLKNAAAANHTVEVVSLVQPDAFRAWSGEDWPRHAPDYLRLKERLIARLLERIEAHAPGFRDLVGFAELATPLTFDTFQRSHDGAFYGVNCSPERLLSPLAVAKSEIPGLFLGGQDVSGPGILGALMGSFLAASAALRPRDRARLWSRLPLTHVPAGSLLAKRPAGVPWKGFLKVAAITAETPTVKTFRLEDPNGGALPFGFVSGQFLTLSLPAAGGTVRRHFSIASPAAETSFCSITVKREPQGLGSGYLHDAVNIGRCLLVEAPAGRFTLEERQADPALPRAALLISGGVGITPIMSMVRQLHAIGSTLPVTLIAAFRSPDEIIYRGELAVLAQAMPTLRLCILVEQPDAAWRGEIGRPTRALIAAALSSDPATTRVQLCGPRPMMDAVTKMLVELGVAPKHIHIEDFAPPVGEGNAARERSIRKILAAAVSAGGRMPAFTVAFREAGRKVSAAAGQSLLDVALANDIAVRNVCGAGICGECRLRVTQGTVETEDVHGILTQREREQGYVLACRSYPTSDIEVAA